MGIGRILIYKKMRQALIQNTIKMIVKFFLTWAGIALIVFSPFGKPASNIIAWNLLMIVVVWSTFNVISVLLQYITLPFYIIKNLSISEGFLEFACNKWHSANSTVQLYNTLRGIGRDEPDDFNKMPELSDVIRVYISFILKEFGIYFIIIGAYMLGINIILKSWILNEYANWTTWEIYLFPFWWCWNR